MAQRLEVPGVTFSRDRSNETERSKASHLRGILGENLEDNSVNLWGNWIISWYCQLVIECERTNYIISHQERVKVEKPRYSQPAGHF